MGRVDQPDVHVDRDAPVTALSHTVEPTEPAQFTCRFCSAGLTTTFVDLGMSPLCQTHIAPEQRHEMEPFYPLHAFVCDNCHLVQLQQFVTPDSIFSEYAYFSSYSTSWVEHARQYAHAMIRRLQLTSQHLVMEIASNDGYLLQHFAAHEIPVLGIEPAANVAEVAIAKGIASKVCFFGNATAREITSEYGQPDLLIGNNVLAHVPDINDFVGGLQRLLAPTGTITMEFPHLQRLIEAISSTRSTTSISAIYHSLLWNAFLRTTDSYCSTSMNSRPTAVRSGFMRAMRSMRRSPFQNGSIVCGSARSTQGFSPQRGTAASMSR